MYNVTWRHIGAANVAVGKTVSITYSECVFVALGIQHEKTHAPYCHMWAV